MILNLYIFPNNTPLNPYKVAKQTEQCTLIFHNVLFSKALLYIVLNRVLLSNWEEEEKETEFEEKQVLLSDLEDMEISLFKVKQVKNDSFIFDMQGTDWRTHEFCGLIIQAKIFTLQWNELTEDAWYVGWDNQE